MSQTKRVLLLASPEEDHNIVTANALEVLEKLRAYCFRFSIYTISGTKEDPNHPVAIISGRQIGTERYVGLAEIERFVDEELRRSSSQMR